MLIIIFIYNGVFMKKYSILKNTQVITGMLFVVTILAMNYITIGLNFKSDLFQTESSYSDLKVSSSQRLFEGVENALNITDSGVLFEENQEISLTNQESSNLTYFLDDTHDWKSSEINFTIKDIYDTREWISDSDFLDAGTPFRKNISESNIPDTPPPRHNYAPNLTPDIIHSTISEPGAKAMRLHFSTLEIEYDWDYLFIYDDNGNLKYMFTGVEANFYSPWFNVDTLKISIDSDGSQQYYGYDIDYFEFYNSSSASYSLFESSWGYDDFGQFTNFALDNFSNNNAIHLSLLGNITRYPSNIFYYATYYENNHIEVYQNYTIPRGQVIDGYISFDYYAESAIETNDFFIYFAIDNQIIYNKGFRDIVKLGRGIWHDTNKIYMDLWSNTSSLFQNIQTDQDFNISVGIMSGASVTYSGFQDAFNQDFWIDNISLVLTTLANSSQDGINLTIDGNSLMNDANWGSSSFSLNNLWSLNPISIEFTTTSPSLSFNLNTSIFGYREIRSKIDQQNIDGLNYYILENGTVIWEFYHNLYMPNEYSDFEFTIDKPENWIFISVLDPTLQTRPYEYGGEGDIILHINKTSALFPGWWSFKATSPNYLDISNTLMLKQGEWINTNFNTGESTRIKTQVNYSGEIPNHIESTEVNLTIYDPEGNQWYSEVNSPLSNGTVFFSEITLSAFNTTGGQFEYTLFWSNGTALGGLKSSFIVYHQSQIKLLKPNDAKIDLRTDGFVGDIIPVRIILTDPENNLSISDAKISYNWTGGSTLNFTEAALGIYETILDTTDLSSRGLYEILISSSKLGFLESNLSLKINLGEETNLQRLESEYNIELHANSSIKFKFTDFGGNGIDGAIINISISNPSHYLIENLGNGIYDIEFSTLYIDNIGIYQLNFSFSATGYEPQYYGYQFQIIEQSVNISVFLNSVNIQENTLHEITFFDVINVSAKVMSKIDKNYISDGIFTWISDSYQKNLTECMNYWYNSSIECLPEHFASGINFIYLKFEHPNYRTQTFGFEVLVERIEFNVDIIGYGDINPTINVEKGGLLELQLRLLDLKTNQTIENGTVLYEWKYGVGELEEITLGIYQLTLRLSENLQGNFIFNLIISKEGTVYKTTQSSFLLVIGEPQFPTFLIWIIIIVSALIIGILGMLSLRSYVILPRKRRKEADLLSRTQRFKDMKNVQAIVISHRLSGIPLYTKSYSLLEKQKKELFSGFIQAITTIGEEIAGKRIIDDDNVKKTAGGIERLIELDFKYFYCLICDREQIRIVLVLQERASNRLKGIISNLATSIILNYSDILEDWDGSIETFEKVIPSIIDQYFNLFYKEGFILNNPKYIASMRKETEFDKMETRVLNTIYSMAKNKAEFFLEDIIITVHEENKDLIIDSIERLLDKKIIIPNIN